MQGYWKEFKQAPEAVTKWNTGLETDLLKFIGAKSVEIPKDFVKHLIIFRNKILLLVYTSPSTKNTCRSTLKTLI